MSSYVKSICTGLPLDLGKTWASIIKTDSPLKSYLGWLAIIPCRNNGNAKNNLISRDVHEVPNSLNPLQCLN